MQKGDTQTLFGQSCDITLFAVSTNPQVLPDFITTTNVYVSQWKNPETQVPASIEKKIMTKKAKIWTTFFFSSSSSSFFFFFFFFFLIFFFYGTTVESGPSPS